MTTKLPESKALIKLTTVALSEEQCILEAIVSHCGCIRGFVLELEGVQPPVEMERIEVQSSRDDFAFKNQMIATASEAPECRVAGALLHGEVAVDESAYLATFCLSRNKSKCNKSIASINLKNSHLFRENGDLIPFSAQPLPIIWLGGPASD